MKGFVSVSDKDNYDDSDLREFDLDDPLLGPPDAIAEPPVDPQLEYLPTDQMSWENFERLLLRVRAGRSWSALARPAARPTAPVVFNVPMGKVSQETGTPALVMPGKIGLK